MANMKLSFKFRLPKSLSRFLRPKIDVSEGTSEHQMHAPGIKVTVKTTAKRLEGQPPQGPEPIE
jgi:hypothetical protein